MAVAEVSVGLLVLLPPQAAAVQRRTARVSLFILVTSVQTGFRRLCWGSQNTSGPQPNRHGEKELTKRNRYGDRAGQRPIKMIVHVSCGGREQRRAGRADVVD